MPGAAVPDAVTTTTPACDTLYYDGRCPLCAAEIAQLRERRGDALQLVDIHAVDSEATPNDLPAQDTLLRTLHLRRANGAWLTGADANVTAWEGTARGRLLRILRWPILRPVVDRVYHYWALWRYRRLYGDGAEHR